MIYIRVKSKHFCKCFISCSTKYRINLTVLTRGSEPEKEAGPSSCCHSIDVQLGRLQGDSRRRGLEHMFVLTRVSTHVSGGSCRGGKKSKTESEGQKTQQMLLGKENPTVL